MCNSRFTLQHQADNTDSFVGLLFFVLHRPTVMLNVTGPMMIILIFARLAAASGVHVGKVLHSNVLSTDVIHHIAQSMKSKSITAM